MSPTAFLFLQAVIVFFVWLVCGFVAQAVARDRNTMFFWVTFLIGRLDRVLVRPPHHLAMRVR